MDLREFRYHEEKAADYDLLSLLRQNVVDR
jgi:hypothetical protein